MYMAKFLNIVLIFLSALFFSGCLVRTYTVEKPRVDLEITGNQGYLQGTSSQETVKEKRKLSSKRKINVLEVELGKHPVGGETKERTKMTEDYPLIEEEELISEDIIMEEPQASSDDIEEDELYAEKKQYQTYTVQQNDTLQKISYKFYNTTKSWNLIYEANKDILKGPDRIYSGQILKIPLE